MGELFRVAIHYASDFGYIEYDPETRQIRVMLDNLVKRDEIEVFLGKQHVLRVARETLRDFAESTGFPAESLATLKIVLTHLWEQTGVFVDWSRPVGAK